MSLARVLIAACLLAPLAARADVKIAYVDLQRALLEVQEGRDAKDRLQGIVNKREKELAKEQDQLRKERELLDKQASAMSDETFRAKERELEQRVAQLMQKLQKGQIEMANLEKDELQSIVAKMEPIIERIAVREGFTLVFDKRDSGLVYAPNHLDITNEVIRTYNDQNKGKGGGGAAKKDAAAPPKDVANKPADAPKK